MSQGLQQPFPKYLAPPGTTVPAEYMQVIPAYTQLNDIVQQYNRKIHRVAPDGNCLFRALSHQVFGDQMYHTQMRAALVTQMSNNLEKYQPFYIGRNPFHQHVSSMCKDGIWGTQLEIQAAADCLGLPIYELMYNSATNCHKWIAFKPRHTVSLHKEIMPQPHFPFTVDHIELLHNKYHYDSIVSDNFCKLQVPSLTPVENTNIIHID